jgi:hypothetical protein
MHLERRLLSGYPYHVIIQNPLGAISRGFVCPDTAWPKIDRTQARLRPFQPLAGMWVCAENGWDSAHWPQTPTNPRGGVQENTYAETGKSTYTG